MVFIIIPTYNERENIERLVREILKQPILDLRVLVVDDNSPDGTAEIVKKLSAEYPLLSKEGSPRSSGAGVVVSDSDNPSGPTFCRTTSPSKGEDNGGMRIFGERSKIEVLHRAGKLGLGSAYRAGFKYCLEKQADFIFEMDADFSHDPNDIPKLLMTVQNGADLAIGSRKIKGGKILGWNWKRKLYSNGAMWFARILLHLKTKDITAGFRCFRAEALKKINYENIKSNGYAFQVEMIYRLERAGLKIVEVPVVFPDRELGKSKLNKKDIIEFFGRVIRLFFRGK